jgi:hypothetical protein
MGIVALTEPADPPAEAPYAIPAPGARAARSFEADLNQILADLGLADRVRVEPAGGMDS